MGIMNTFMVILFAAGIMNSAMGQTEFQDEMNGTSDNYPTTLKPPGYINRLEDECERNGGPDTFANLEESQKTVALCFETAIHQSLQPEFGVNITAIHENASEIDIANICRHISKLQNCVQLYTEPFKVCVEPKYRDNVDSRFKTIVSLMDFACEDDAHRIKGLLAGNGKECLISKKTALQSCIRQLYMAQIPDGVTEGSKSPRSSDPEDCSNYHEIHHCTVRALKECENEAPANIFDSVFELLEKSPSCSGNSHESGSSLADANVLLAMTAVTVTTMIPLFHYD